MKIIKRTMTSEITQTNDEYAMSCQASLNSDGGITLTRPPQSWCYVEELGE